jgi:hypothetical protein
MGLKKGLKNAFNAVAGNLPVIGPHAGIEAELLLAGKKPLGWTSVDPDNMVFNDPQMQAEHEGRKKLDEAVRQGKLVSADVVVHTANDEKGNRVNLETPWLFRHYCQPGNEENLQRIVAFNTKAFNFEEPDYALLEGKDIGEYLGYRSKDINLWYKGGMRGPLNAASRFVAEHVNSDSRRMKIMNAMGQVSHLVQKRAQPAYQQKMLRKIEKEQKKADKKSRKNRPGA